MVESLNNPTIVHLVLCDPKIWEANPIYNKLLTSCEKRGNCSCQKYHDLWHFYANRTNYYEEIKNYTGKKS